jgi:hypothetical protein
MFCQDEYAIAKNLRPGRFGQDRLNLAKKRLKWGDMGDIGKRFERLGLFLPEILLPGENVDPQKWAVIACDQFTQDRGYWEKTKNAASGGPSSLNLILPEVYLADEDKAQRIDDIHRTMERYLSEGVFSPTSKGCVYLERNTPFNRGRRGLVIAVDLEHYDWSPQARRLVRSTEGTVAERLPPRMDIRRNAALESTHVLLLIDDDKDGLLPALAEHAKRKPPVYQCPLMMESGDISGWLLDGEDDWNFLANELEKLKNRAAARYPHEGAEAAAEPFLFAVGDGNHSLATAKEIWEEYKKQHGCVQVEGISGGARPCTELPEHPCRYALVEIENIYDPAIQFEPIHRILFGVNFDDAVSLLSALPGCSCRTVSEQAELVRLIGEPISGNRFGIVSADDTHGNRYVLIKTSLVGLATASLQPLLDRWLEGRAGKHDRNEPPHGETPSIDYIHGEDELFRLSAEKSAVGILLPPIKKSGLFETVARLGPLPRKSFSMGAACEKRFYFECRKLFG